MPIRPPTIILQEQGLSAPSAKISMEYGTKKEVCPIFLGVLLGITVQRDIFAHEYFHAFKDVKWENAWEMVEALPNLRAMLNDAIKQMKEMPKRSF
jgi:hypothetical protein